MSIVIMYVILIFMFLSTLVEHITFLTAHCKVLIELDISAIEKYVIIIIIIMT